MKNFGIIVRDLRRSRGESQAAIARRAGISQGLVSRIEAGRGSLDRVISLCRALGVPVEIRIGRTRLSLVHALDPEERREIEANIDWFSRLRPADRLRLARRHRESLERLRAAAAAARRGRADRGA